MSAPPFEEIEHTADWALRVRGETLPELFVHAAQGMYHLLGAERMEEIVFVRSWTVKALDAESLLVEWLNELLYWTESKGELFDEFEIEEWGETQLRARTRGGPGRTMKKQIKAATFHNLKIEKTDDGYETVIVFDV